MVVREAPPLGLLVVFDPPPGADTLVFARTNGTRDPRPAPLGVPSTHGGFYVKQLI
jgi:hypothetical protein